MSESNIYDGVDRRSAERNEKLVEAVVVAVRAEVAIKAIPDELHRKHHAFMDEWMAEQARKKEFREKIKTQVGGWAIITILSTMGTLAYQGFLWAKEHYK